MKARDKYPQKLMIYYLCVDTHFNYFWKLPIVCEKKNQTKKMKPLNLCS